MDVTVMTQMRTVLLALTIAAAVSPALAETPAEKTAPQGQDAPGPDTGATATTPPADSKGVIQPPATGDTGIQTQVPNPNAGSPEEVIPPPGTPGGNPSVEPR